MTCERFRESIRDMLRAESPPAPAQKHCEECRECALEWERERLLNSALAMAAEEAAAATPTPGLEAKTIEALRNRRRAPWWRSRWMWTGAAAAASAAVVLILVAGRSASAPAAERPREIVATPAVSPPLPEIAPPAPRPVPAAKAVTARRANPPGNPRKRVETGTEFFVLRQPVALPDEDLQVIRIRLPRREMRRFGMPVSAEGDGLPVQADVVIGDDGSARAVRFVR